MNLNNDMVATTPMNNPFFQTHVLPLGPGLRDSGRKASFIAADAANFVIFLRPQRALPSGSLGCGSTCTFKDIYPLAWTLQLDQKNTTKIKITITIQ